MCPPPWARARGAVLCSLCSLTPVAAPTHCTPAPPVSDRGCSLSLPLSVPVSVSVSRPLRLARSLCLSGFHRSQPRSPRVEGSALPAQTATPDGRENLPPPAWTRVSQPRRGRPRHSVSAKKHEGRAIQPFRFALKTVGMEEGRERGGERGKKKPMTQSRRLRGALSFTRKSKRLVQRFPDTDHLWVFLLQEPDRRVQGFTDLFVQY